MILSESDPACTLCSSSASLLEKHHREIVEGSGVGEELARAHFFSVTAAEAQALGFSRDQAGDGWAVEYISPTGEVSYQLKRDEPRPDKDGDLVKYETPTQQTCVVDVGDASAEDLQNVAVDLVVLEGSKKAYCARTRGWLVACLAGVWNGTKKRERGGVKYGRPELLPDWNAIALEGRKVFIAFDADFRTKRGVAQAIMCLARRLMEWGAHVFIISMPGTEMGLDDYAVAGGDLDALKRAARPYQPCDFTPYAATRDRRVVETVEALRRRMALDVWEGKAGKTDHSLMRAVLELALERGRWCKEGEVEIVVPTRELQDRGAIGSRTTLAIADGRLEERGYVAKESGDRKNGKANRYFLKTPKLDHLIGEEGKHTSVPITGPVSSVYIPHLRWPAPPAPEDAPKRSSSTPLYALGKAAEFALHRLASWGGRATVGDLATASGYSDASKFRADVLEDLVVSEIIELDEKRKRQAEARLSSVWRDALDERREQSGEFAKARRRAVEYRHSREAYYNPSKADPEPELRGREHNERVLEKLRKDEEGRWIEEQRQKVGTTATVFLTDELEGAVAVRWQELRARWLERGGKGEDLRRAVIFGPFRFMRETADYGALYIYPGIATEIAGGRGSRVPGKKEGVSSVVPKYLGADPEDSFATHTLAKFRPYKGADGVYVHPPECACEWCGGESFELSYAETPRTA